MSDKIVALIGSLLTKWILPYLFSGLQDWLEGIYEHLKEYFENRKVQRAYKKSSDEAKKKYDAVVADPKSTPGDRANAFQDLINSKPDIN